MMNSICFEGMSDIEQLLACENQPGLHELYKKVMQDHEANRLHLEHECDTQRHVIGGLAPTFADILREFIAAWISMRSHETAESFASKNHGIITSLANAVDIIHPEIDSKIVDRHEQQKKIIKALRLLADVDGENRDERAGVEQIKQIIMQLAAKKSRSIAEDVNQLLTRRKVKQSVVKNRAPKPGSGKKRAKGERLH